VTLNFDSEIQFSNRNSELELTQMLKKILGILLLVALIGGFIAWQKYQEFFSPNVPSELSVEFVEIPTGSSYQEVLAILDKGGFLIDTSSFTETAALMKYPRPQMRPGRYKIQPNWSNKQLIGHLRGGKQAPVKLVLTNERMTENVAAKAARFIEADSLEIVSLFQDKQYLAELGYTPETLMSLFIPNTYEVFWNTSAKGFIERMKKEHDIFWKKNDRVNKAKALEMKPEEVYTMASIVEKETNYNAEKKRMAGVYVNRIEKGILLQADPTSVFARRDFTTKRVTDYHTKFDSPYNTYLYAGLPPGPIAMASISSIDAVLGREKHSYLYFCSKGDGTGQHNFAKSLRGHNQNAAIYVRNLKKRGLR